MNLLRALGSLFEDLLLMHASTPQLVRNIDMASELGQLAQSINVDWLDGAAHALGQVQSGMRRNLLRPLSLDAMTLNLAER